MTKHKLPSWLEIYRRLRRPPAPRERAHGEKGYGKADRRKAKREIKRELEE